jgi:methylornithine synthase
LSVSQVLRLEEILDKAAQEISLTYDEIVFLLELDNHEQIEKVFQVARDLRTKHFDNKIFLYGFIYFSTYCRNNCTFCLYRKTNNVFERYRKSKDEILDAASRFAESGVHLLDLTMGEDPEYLNDAQGTDRLIDLVRRVKETTGLPIMISPGVVPEHLLAQLKNAGADWYACYQETHNRQLYKKLRTRQSYDERMEIKQAARKMGLLIEEGLLAGIGETTEDIAQSIQVMKNIEADQVRVMSFVPQEGTPMWTVEPPHRLRELLIIAVMRLTEADRLIPASLDVDGLVGLKERIQAGANVVTSIIPPKTGLAGVSHSYLDIDEGNRSVERVIAELKTCGLESATIEEYFQWIERRKNKAVTASKRSQ